MRPGVCDPTIPGPLSYRAQSPGSRQPTDRAGGGSGWPHGARGAAGAPRWTAQLLSSRGSVTRRSISTKRDGFDSTTSSRRTLFPGARLGNCLRHALNKLPGKLTAIASPVRKALRSQFHPLLYRARQRKGLRVFALAQRLRHFADHVTQSAGVANGERVRRWFQEKKAGWYAVLADPQMPGTSTLLDQAHNAIARNLFMMKGFHPPKGNQQAFLRGLAHLYNLVPYQRRAKHAGQCGVEGEGGRVPTRDWFLNRQILTSGGFRCAMIPLTTKSGGMWKFWPSRLPARHREIVYARRFLLVLWEYSDTGQFAGFCLVSVMKLVHELSAFLGRFSQDSNMFRTFDTDDEGRHEVEDVLAH